VTAEEVLTKVLEAGGRVIPDPTRPRLFVPPALEPLVIEHRVALRALVLGSADAALSSPTRDPELDAVTVREVLGDSPPPEMLQALRAEMQAALAQVDRELQSGRIGLAPILVRGKPLADWLSLDELAARLRRAAR
jgi:hypothetical protein